MDDVATWLSRLGLNKYADVFAKNDIGPDILPRLTEAHLKELGVSLGDRLRLLEAIEGLRKTNNNVPPADVSSDGASTTHEAERRQLTVMFCDLVGSTELSTRLDPEDLQYLISAYQAACSKVIAEYDGFIAKYMGDGILVYFGYPRAHGDDPERAVRAGLGSIIAMIEVDRSHAGANKSDLAVRIGINTGLVVVGDIIGQGASQEANVIGETPNVAARLQALAQPNQVVIGPLTHQLVAETFACVDLGEHSLKGINEPMHAWRVLNEQDIDSADNAILGDGGPPLVGREEELGLLLRSWEASKGGHGQVVLIQGDAGLGKSRLIRALRERMAGDEYLRVAIRCSAYHANSTLYPVIEHLKRALNWIPEDSAEKKLEKLEIALQQLSLPLTEAVPLIAELMSLPLPTGRYMPLALNAKQAREHTLDTLAGWLLEEAESRPMLLIWEDLHWADPTTLELLELYIGQSPTVSMMNVLTYRPDFVMRGTMRSHMTPITLNRLERREVEAIITHHAGGKAVPVDVIEHIVGKADGVPLYVEELTKTILGSDYVREETNCYTLVSSISELPVPETLKESLMARLDRFPEVREVAQMSAVLGREFSYEMLSAISDLEEPALIRGLAQLVDSELLHQRGRPPRAKYVFKHALVQNAAYDSLLKRTRRKYHHRAANALEKQFPEIVETQPELIASHFAMAENTNEAITYFQKAGIKALGRSANVEAVNHLQHGLDLLALLLETQERDELELKLQMALGPPLVAIRGFANPSVGRTYSRAWELCQNLEDNTHLPLVIRGRQVFHLLRGELVEARKYAEQLLTLAEQTNDPALIVGGCHALGQTLFQHGDLNKAREVVEKGINLFDPHRHRLVNWSGGQPGEQCLLYGAFVLWILGYPERALRYTDEALRLANELKNPANLINTLAFAATVSALRREHSEAAKYATAAIQMSEEHRNPTFLGHSSVIRGWARAAQNEVEAGIAEVAEGITAFRATGARTWMPFFLGLQAEAHARSKQIDGGLRLVRDALTIVEETQQYSWKAELKRIEGELLSVASEGRAAPEECLLEALSIARRQNARCWELRTANVLFQFWKDQDRQSEALDLLHSVYDWFTEGFDTPDIRTAKILLG